MKEDFEELSETERDVRCVLGSLYKIEAPKDFDFHLKAKIANADPKRFQTSYARRFAYVLPVSALAIAIGAVGFYGNFIGGEEQKTVTAPTPSSEIIVAPAPAPTPQIALEIKDETIPSSDKTKPVVEPKLPAPKQPSEKKILVAEERKELQQGSGKKREKEGSADKAQSAPNVINQSDKDLQQMKKEDDEKDFSSKDVFGTIGIETVTENGKLRVKSVRPDSPAARSGINENDVIDSINNKKVTGDKIRAKTIEVNKIKVKRGEADIELDLKTKQQ